MQTYTADNVVKWWSKWDEEEKYMSMQDHADSGEMCCLWFSTYSKKAALLQILDIEFAKADSDMQVRYTAAVAAGTAHSFFGKRAEPSGSVMFAEFVKSHGSNLYSQGLSCTEIDVVAQWRAASDSETKMFWIYGCKHDLSCDELSIPDIFQLLQVEFDQA
jgi:hypothetical protein